MLAAPLGRALDYHARLSGWRRRCPRVFIAAERWRSTEETVREIAVFDRVRVVALTGSAADHLVLVTAERPPQLGDVGTVVDIADALGGVGRHYTVELTREGARTVWLAVFGAHELAIVR